MLKVASGRMGARNYAWVFKVARRWRGSVVYHCGVRGAGTVVSPDWPCQAICLRMHGLLTLSLPLWLQ